MSWDKCTNDNRESFASLLKTIPHTKTLKLIVDGQGLNDVFDDDIMGDCMRYELYEYLININGVKEYYYDQFTRNSDCDIDDTIYTRGPFKYSQEDWKYLVEVDNEKF